jgi:hypothetical protein
MEKAKLSLNLDSSFHSDIKTRFKHAPYFWTINFWGAVWGADSLFPCPEAGKSVCFQ